MQWKAAPAALTKWRAALAALPSPLRHDCCRLAPHGGRILLPVVLATLALGASLADDGCDSARVSGAAAALLAGSPAVPYVECGPAGLRAPGFYPAENAWRVAFRAGGGRGACAPYPHGDVLRDAAWMASEAFLFLGLVLGGTTASFLWAGTCLTLRPRQWRVAGVGAAAAGACQALSLVWFAGALCHTKASNFEEFEDERYGREVELAPSAAAVASTCALFFGARCAIASCVLYSAAAAVVLLGGYPAPEPRLVVKGDAKAVDGPGPRTRTRRHDPRRRELVASTSTAGTQSTAHASTHSLPRFASMRPTGEGVRIAGNSGVPPSLRGNGSGNHYVYPVERRGAELVSAALNAQGMTAVPPPRVTSIRPQGRRESFASHGSSDSPLSDRGGHTAPEGRGPHVAGQSSEPPPNNPRVAWPPVRGHDFARQGSNIPPDRPPAAWRQSDLSDLSYNV